METAINLFLNTIKLYRNTDNNKYIFHTKICCGHTIPDADKTDGIKNSDLHIYLNGDINEDDINARGCLCFIHSVYKRPTFGVIRLNVSKFNQIGATNQFF